MKLTNNIVLDFYIKKNYFNENYWIYNFISINTYNTNFVENKVIKLSKFNELEFKYKNKFLQNEIKFLNILNKKNTKSFFTINTINNIINLNFLKKEILYTKLKYSRSPAYDSVSGASAALFAGLLAFLVTEKFGFELVDSGDFYYVYMYVVFLSFFTLPLVYTTQSNYSISELISPKSILIFYKTIIILFFFKL